MAEMSAERRDALARALWRDRMAHYGYTSEQIDALDQPLDHEAHGCYFENWNWVCVDEDEKPNHPDHDEAAATAEWVCWALDHPSLAEWSAQDRAEWGALNHSEAWDEGWRAAKEIVLLDGEKAWAHTVMPEGYEGNPYRAALTPGADHA